MSPYVKKLSEELNKSISETQELWNKQKESYSITMNKKEEAFELSDFNSIYNSIKKSVEPNEKLINPEYFLNSELSAKDFIKETMTSSAVTSVIKDTIVNRHKDKEEPEKVETEEDRVEVKKELPKKKEEKKHVLIDDTHFGWE